MNYSVSLVSICYQVKIFSSDLVSQRLVNFHSPYKTRDKSIFLINRIFRFCISSMLYGVSVICECVSLSEFILRVYEGEDGFQNAEA
jgi:hypothetical protein